MLGKMAWFGLKKEEAKRSVGSFASSTVISLQYLEPEVSTLNCCSQSSVFMSVSGAWEVAVAAVGEPLLARC